jgi:microcin C transport system permease protein
MTRNGRITRCNGIESLLPPGATGTSLRNRNLDEFWTLPPDYPEKVAPFWNGEATATLEILLTPREGTQLPPVTMVIAGSEARGQERKSIRARLLESGSGQQNEPVEWLFTADAETPLEDAEAFSALPREVRNAVEEMRSQLRAGRTPESGTFTVKGRSCTVTAEAEEARFPFRPVKGHWMGIDDAGRDVFARIVYGLRLALNFGAILVFFSLAGGSFFGIMQGYMGGKVDMFGQRLIEIWSAMPFLYVMILMGSIYGTGFVLLLICYALFNWIGISYFMRAETLRLRRQPFVEAAQCMGLSGWKIAWKHILPNALVPLVTFFPFSLVGAIGSLAALDYLGFGLPVPSPSLGELMAQGQVHRWAWWLIFFPAAALFMVMLLGVMVGEGIRNAFDPRRQSRMQ